MDHNTYANHTLTSSLARGTKQLKSSTMQTSNTWHGKKFSFLRQLNKQDWTKGTDAIEERQQRKFLPYFTERDELGNLLKRNDPISSHSQEPKQGRALHLKPPVKKDEDEVPETASQCSTDSKKERFVAKKLAELDDFNLNKNLKRALDGKRNDPARQSTYTNLDKIKRNARLKILKQLKFSNQTDLRFEKPDHQRSQAPEILNNNRFASKLEAMENQSIPEETFREHESYAMSMKTSARQNDQVMLGSTKYGTNNSVTDYESQLPEGVQ